MRTTDKPTDIYRLIQFVRSIEDRYDNGLSYTQAAERTLKAHGLPMLTDLRVCCANLSAMAEAEINRRPVDGEDN